MGKISLTLLGICVIGYALTIKSCVRGEYEYEAYLGSHWSLADKSSTIPQKSAHINRFVSALEAQKFEGMHNATIYLTPDNSFDRNLDALRSLQSRLREIQGMNPSSFEYQTAIQQITQQEQGEAQPMLEVFYGVWWLKHHSWLWNWHFSILTGVLALVGVLGLGFGFARMEDF